MEDFKVKKEEYFKKVNDNFDIFQKIVLENKDNSNMDVIVMPGTPEEVDIADAILTYFVTVTDYLNFANREGIEKRDFKDNFAYNLYLNIINLLKNFDKQGIEEIKKYITTEVSPKDMGKCFYDLLYCLIYYPEFSESLCKDCGFDEDDELSYFQFNHFLEKAKKVANPNNATLINFRNMSEEERIYVDRTKESIREFTRLVDEEINKSKGLKREK